MASSSSCSWTSRGRAVIGLGKGLWTAVGNTYATCSSELVLWAISAAVVRARRASLEPSVASRIFVGNMLIEVASYLYLPFLSTMMPLVEASCISAQTYSPELAEDKFPELRFSVVQPTISTISGGALVHHQERFWAMSCSAAYELTKR